MDPALSPIHAGPRAPATPTFIGGPSVHAVHTGSVGRVESADGVAGTGTLGLSELQTHGVHELNLQNWV